MMKLLACTLLSCAAFAQDAATLHKLFDQYYEDQLRWSPELATRVGRNEFNHLWSDVSRAAREQRRAALQEYARRLDAFTGSLSDQDRISRELLRYEITRALENEPLQPLLRVSQMGGFHNRVLATVEQMPAATVRDYENIVARLNAVPSLIDANIAWISEAIERGYVQPRSTVELTMSQVAAQGAMNEDKSPLLGAFRRMPASIAQPDRDRLLREARTAYGSKVVPAWQRYHAFLRDTYLPKARAQAGLSAIPQGNDWYARLVRDITTTSLTPREIHEIGRKELARIEAAMIAIARETGFTGDLAAFEKKLRSSPEHLFRSKEDMLVFCRNVAMIAAPELPKLFKRIPRMPLGIRAIPEDREAVSASHYLAPSLDGTRAGFFMLNAYEPQKQVRYTKPALVLHEGSPGHHFQIALQQELEGLPQFRKLYGNTAYIEGWALYAESLGDVLGVYADSYSRFGKLSSERFRSVRLVVDTGLHAMGWTREQAVQFFNEHAPDASLAEIDRYIAWPAQALGYKIGELKIKELRARAESKLGPKFDVREFHDVVLRNGPLPLELLEKQVETLVHAPTER